MTQDTKRTSTAVLLFTRAQDMDLNPSWLEAKRIFTIQTAYGERFINRGVSDLNSPVSVGLARNKYRTRMILERHNLPNIPYLRTIRHDRAYSFLKENGTIIVKPNRGEGSKDVHIVRTKSKLETLRLNDTIIEKYTPGKEMRYLVLAGNIIAVHESRYGESVDPQRELERISYGMSEWNEELAAMSLRICEIFGLGFAAIDFIIDNTGPKVLEINSSPGFKWFHAPNEGPMVDVAKLFLEETIKQLG